MLSFKQLKDAVVYVSRNSDRAGISSIGAFHGQTYDRRSPKKDRPIKHTVRDRRILRP